MVDTTDLKSVASNGVPVRVRSAVFLYFFLIRITPSQLFCDMANVMVGLSGVVDSAVAAALLVEQGQF